MFERFTDRARRVVVLAQEEARMLSHNYIGTEHLLLGLLHEGEGTAAQALGALGIELDTTRQRLAEITPMGTQPPSGHIRFTPRAKKVLEHALREAQGLGHDYMGTEHILLGLLREPDGLAAQILVRLDVDLEQVRGRVLELAPGRPGERPEELTLDDLITAAEGRTLSSAALEGVVNRRSEEILRRLEAVAGRLSVIERHLGMGREPGPSPGAAPGA
ncbi:MAG: ATP-dependent Clp protease ATP-binding subunit ClpC [Streptosporangiaceae bacterium]|nr:ATP-dependent Clp protease ATP-binding subunit ClpC [Streptosporangiaceae bacterium]